VGVIWKLPAAVFRIRIASIDSFDDAAGGKPQNVGSEASTTNVQAWTGRRWRRRVSGFPSLRVCLSRLTGRSFIAAMFLWIPFSFCLIYDNWGVNKKDLFQKSGLNVHILRDVSIDQMAFRNGYPRD